RQWKAGQASAVVFGELDPLAYLRGVRRQSRRVLALPDAVVVITTHLWQWERRGPGDQGAIHHVDLAEQDPQHHRVDAQVGDARIEDEVVRLLNDPERPAVPLQRVRR